MRCNLCSTFGVCAGELPELQCIVVGLVVASTRHAVLGMQCLNPDDG